MPQLKFRNFCFTFYGEPSAKGSYCFEDLESKLTFDENDNTIVYIVYGWEICPDSNRKHLQGFCQLKNAYGVKWIQNRLVGGIKMHIEKAKGTATEASEYCKKDGFYYEHGTLREQGERTDLNKIKEALVAGMSLDDVQFDLCENLQQMKYAEAINRIILKRKERTEKPRIYWIHGDTNLGKSHFVKTNFPDAYWHFGSYDSWNAYESQSEIVFDDFRCSDIPLKFFLKITDVYKIPINVKYGHSPLLAKVIIFTSPKGPEHQYNNTDENREQFYRRITDIIHFRKDGTFVRKENGISLPEPRFLEHPWRGKEEA